MSHMIRSENQLYSVALVGAALVVVLISQFFAVLGSSHLRSTRSATSSSTNAVMGVTTTATEEPISNTQAGWKNYYNQAFDFALMVPQGWQVSTVPFEGVAVLTNYSYSPDNPVETTPGQVKSVVYVEDNPDKLIATEWEQEYRTGELLSREPIVVDGNDGVLVKLKDALGVTGYWVIVPHGDSMYMISWDSEDPSEFTSILGTLKFEVTKTERFG